MRAKKPTYEQRKVLEDNGLDTYEWYVKKVYPDKILVQNKNTGEEKFAHVKPD